MAHIPNENNSTAWERESLNHKPMGAFGAPACHWTPTLVAMSISLSGLILLGIGAVLAGFLAHEPIPYGTGLALVVIGLLMMLAGGVFFIWDMKKPKVGARENDRSVRYQVGVGSVPSSAPSATPAPSVSSAPQMIASPNRQRPRQQHNIANVTEAPPAYTDVVMQSNVQNESLQSTSNAPRQVQHSRAHPSQPPPGRPIPNQSVKSNEEHPVAKQNPMTRPVTASTPHFNSQGQPHPMGQSGAPSRPAVNNQNPSRPIVMAQPPPRPKVENQTRRPIGSGAQQPSPLSSDV